MEKRVLWIALFLAVIWTALPSSGVLQAQCNGGVNAGTITPTLSWQTIPCVSGGEYYRFYANVGTYYTFTYCFAGGDATFDTEITINDDSDVFAGGLADQGDCGLGDHLWYWTPPTSGWYRVLITKFHCQTDTRCTILAYHSELDPYSGPGRTCASPWIIPSLPYVQSGMSTCFFNNNYNNNPSCSSNYMSGEDFVFRFSGTAGQCISIYANNTFIYTGIFLFNGCPNVVGTNCIAYREGAAANPQMTNITLPTTGTYYLIVDSYSAIVSCTPFDISIYNCVAVGQGSTCANAFTIPSLPYSQSGFTTCTRGNTYTSSMACGSPYMNGEDFVFKYVSPGNECINLSLSMTLTNTGFFIFDGCPNVPGTNCIASRTSSGGNPKLRDIALTAPGTYYIMVSTQPSPSCTPFDISVEHCPPECSRNLNISDACSGPTLVALGLTDTVCGHSSYFLTPDVTTDLQSDFCGSIENNGWFSFVADSTTMTMRIDVNNCLSGFGIQGRVYQTADCINYTPKSNCWNPMQQSNGIIQATGLVVGTTYLLMIDGYNGDDCDFNIYRIYNTLPVEWSHFNASLVGPREVKINWSTATEVNNRGFYVQRGHQTGTNHVDQLIWESLDFVSPRAQSGQGADYQYVDHPEYLGYSWYYRIQQVDLDGTSSYSSYKEIALEGGESGDLQAIYPNPASTHVNLKYYASKSGATAFVLYDVAGMLVKQKNFSNDGQGIYDERIDIEGLPNGLYIYVLSINGKIFSGKLELIH